jgi:hypothetical protein
MNGVRNMPASQANTSNCWSCGPLELYLDKAEAFTGNLSDALTPAMLILFVALLGVWVIYTGVRVVMEPGAVKGTIAKDLLALLFTSILLEPDPKLSFWG